MQIMRPAPFVIFLALISASAIPLLAEVDPKVSVEDVTGASAAGVVLVHNHPSGDPHPSTEDIAMTTALVAACEAVGLPLLDHVIVAVQGAVSLFELGVFPVNAA